MKWIAMLILLTAICGCGGDGGGTGSTREEGGGIYRIVNPSGANHENKYPLNPKFPVEPKGQKNTQWAVLKQKK